MVKFFQSSFEYHHPWDLVTGAIFQKYPNPFASHVLSADIIDQFVDPNTGNLHTIRLLLKRGIIPKWGRSLLHTPDAFIIEHSVVDPKQRIMKTVTKNLNHTKLMLVEETQYIREYKERIQQQESEVSDIPQQQSTPPAKSSSFAFWKSSSSSSSQSSTPQSKSEQIIPTIIESEARIISNIGWQSMRSKIEGFGVKRFSDNVHKSSKGLLHVMEKLKEMKENGMHKWGQ